MRNFLHKWAMIRICLGMFIVLDGSPLFFFVKETLMLAPGNTNVTAAFLLIGLAMMIPSTVLRKLYMPNMPVFNALMAFVIMCVLYSFLFNEIAVGERSKDLIYYVFVFMFMLLLINVPNEMTRYVIVVGVFFTFISNVGLVIALITDPDWTLGQRAAIQFGEPGERMGNPHVFSRNAQIGLLCCLMWGNRRDQSFFIKIIALSLVIFNIIILMLTFSKSAILSTVVTAVIYLLVNLRHSSPQKLFKTLTSPISLIVISMPFIAFIGLVIVKPEIWEIITLYGDMIFGRFSENILALLGAENEKGDLAEFDGSSVNRVMSWTYVTYAVMGDPLGLIMGYGYKFFFMDIPVLETLINQGIFGFLLYAFIFYQLGKESLKVAYYGGKTEVEVMAAYLFFLFLVSYFTSGRPYEMATLHPLCLFTRFLGITYPPQLSRGYVDETTPPVDIDQETPPTLQPA
ncbi:O-antigen ligase family protein [Fibrella aquatica]|uniref:O-antigen ligase family protein n=1 Tax=Fibrella aquatica TaxID=3242487 RepID=UPI003520968E